MYIVKYCTSVSCLLVYIVKYCTSVSCLLVYIVKYSNCTSVSCLLVYIVKYSNCTSVSCLLVYIVKYKCELSVGVCNYSKLLMFLVSKLDLCNNCKLIIPTIGTTVLSLHPSIQSDKVLRTTAVFHWHWQPLATTYHLVKTSISFSCDGYIPYYRVCHRRPPYKFVIWT